MGGSQPHRLGLQVFLPPWLLVTCPGMPALREMTECLGPSGRQVFPALLLPAPIPAAQLLCELGRPREGVHLCEP